MGPGFESLKVHQNGGIWAPTRRDFIKIVRVSIAEGPPVPIPNTEVKLCYADNTCLETSREDRSMRTLWRFLGSPLKQIYSYKRIVRVSIAEGPPVPIPNTEVKLCYADNTCLETSREDRSMRTLWQLYFTTQRCCVVCPSFDFLNTVYWTWVFKRIFFIYFGKCMECVTIIFFIFLLSSVGRRPS